MAMADEPIASTLALAYIEALERKDLDAILALLTDDFELEVPNTGSGEALHWHGLDAAAKGYAWAFEVIEVSKYVDVELSQGADPNVAFIEALGDMMMTNGRPYCNRYVFRFDAVDGKLRRVREYINPIVSAISFARALPADVIERLSDL